MSLFGQIANREIVNFLRTATIKNSYFAERSRTLHIRPNVVDKVPQNETPYYRHMAGEYILKGSIATNVTNPKTGELEGWFYSNKTKLLDVSGEPTDELENRYIYTEAAFDEMMYITSLDTGETIPFTLDLLHKEYAEDETKVHTKTLEAYKLPSRYYELLCEQYPNQVDLIKAIVYPVKSARPLTAKEIYQRDHTGLIPPSILTRRKDYLVSADNFEILNYDDTLLAKNERPNLTSTVRILVDLIKERWFVKEYNIEENYNSVLWTVMWCVLTFGLIGQRYVNIKTPFVHESHIWDYLVSKGLKSYQGYLTLDQTLFLYKNIEYILKHRGKQRTTNILIDNLLNNVGLIIKSKTVVLDTTKTLDESGRYQAIDNATQCSTCTKRSWCHKNIKDYVCPDRQAIDNLCKPEPVILTEEFAGASKEKVVELLMTQYGYSKADAIAKYNRSLLWKDDEVAEVKEALDRDQMTDLNGPIESLDTLIQNEYASKLEPIYNKDVVAEQFNDLRHINGTYAPTKILEVMKKSANPRFTKLFGNFLTDTLLHLCPRVIDGRTYTKVRTAYSFTVQGVNSDHVLNFGEMFAALYLGLCREFDIEVIHDHIVPVSETGSRVYEDGKVYFAYTDSTTEQVSKYSAYNNASRLKLLTEGVHYRVGDPMREDAYVWAPTNAEQVSFLKMIAGHELLTNLLGSRGYNFPIPSRAKLTTALKFGKPVKQKDLVTAWNLDTGEYERYLPLFSVAKKVLKISDFLYGVTDEGVVADPEIWTEQPVQLVIEGVIKDGTAYKNNGEIPIIPQFFKWHFAHMEPQNESAVVKQQTHKYLLDEDFIEAEETSEDPTPRTTQLKFDETLGQYYQLLEVDRYFDVKTLIDDYMDLMEDVTDEAVIGEYLNKQFTLLERIYCTAAESLSVKTHLAASAILKAISMDGTYIDIDLTGMARRTTWPVEGVSAYGVTPVKCATYADWFRSNKEIGAVFDTVDKSSASKTIWNMFNTNTISLLTEGCTLPYLSSAIDNTVIDKLKELITHLSSYKVAFINVSNTEKSCDSLMAFAEDYSAMAIREVGYEYVMPILDATWAPRAGGYAKDGSMYVYTHDTVAKPNKSYYKAVTDVKLFNSSSQTIGNYNSTIDLDSDTLRFEKVVSIQEGDTLPDRTYFEVIDLFELLGVTGEIVRFERDANRNWYYSVGTRHDVELEVPASEADDELENGYDTFLSLSYVSSEIRQKCKAKKYRKYVSTHEYEWSEPVLSEKLKYWLDPMVKPYTVKGLDKDSTCVARIVELDGNIEVYGQIQSDEE